MYGHEPPTPLKIRELLLLEACPASGGPRTEMPKAQLARWSAVADSVGDWYRGESGSENIPQIEERHMAWLDPVQRQIVSTLFSTFRQIMPKRDHGQVEVGSNYSEVWDREANATIGAATQLSITRAGTIERLKLKTGRSRVSPEEKAVLLDGTAGTDDTDVRFTEVNVATGEIDDIEMAEGERTETIRRLFSIPGRPRGGGTVPGLHCYQCSRPSRCGQYPSLEPKLSGSESRGVLVSKRWLAMLPTCQRQVAWARLYSIPTDEGEEDGDAARLGSSFHQGAASALLAQDPEAAFATYAASAPGSEQAVLLQLWENHKHLVEQEPFPVEMKDTEYGIGVTCHAPGLFIDSKDREHTDRLIAVTFAGFADGVGREADGTPSVVELKTGRGSSLPFEPELYALGAHLLTGKVPVTVHIHRIGNRDDLACDRRVFDESKLGEAKTSLQEATSLVAAWHPYNSLSAPYSVGEWCRWCPFEIRCTGHRT